MFILYKIKDNIISVKDSIDITYLEAIKKFGSIENIFPNKYDTDKIFEYPFIPDIVIYKNGYICAPTREDLIKQGKSDLIKDGEYLENGEIKFVEQPSSLVKPIWDKNTHTWKESATKEELLFKRKDKILEYKKVEEEIDALEEFKTEFESDNTIAFLRERLAKIKKEIDDLLVKIKQLA